MNTLVDPTLLDRARRGLGWRLRKVRDTIEWQAAHSIHGRGPWCRNRWGHRYQAISLAEYHYLRDGNPETFEARLLERLLRPGMTVFDVGANHGLFSLEAAHLIGPSGRVHAFEPAPSTRDLLRRNLEGNDATRVVRIVPSAVGGAPGTARLRIHRDLSGLNTLAGSDIVWNHQRLRADDLVDVPVTTLDDHAEAERIERIDFLKIDVEGFELAVLRGASRLLSEQRVGWIMVEVGDVTCANARVDPADIPRLLDEHGYLLHAITPEGTLGARVRAFPDHPFAANFLAATAATIEANSPGRSEQPIGGRSR